MSNTTFNKLDTLFGAHTEILMQRFTRALEHCEADRALIFAGSPRLRDRDDQPYPFRADPYFLQWVPLPDAAGSCVEIRPGRKPHLLLARDEDFWHAPPQLPPEDTLGHLDVSLCRPAEVGRRLAASSDTTLSIGAGASGAAETEFPESSELIAFLDFDRAIKTGYELDCMRRATHMAVAGHAAVARAAREGRSEFELHMRYCEAAGLSDEGLPYSSIVGLNEHAAILHYQHRDTTAPAHALSLLIDAGAQYRGYAADVTRTYALYDRALGNRAADDQAFDALIMAVDALQRAVCEQATAGVDFVTLNETCHQRLAGVLHEFGLITCTPETAYEAGATTVFLPHGLGHLLGLQVHDVGGHSLDRRAGARKPPERHPFLRLTRTLEPDMVLTIEPGLYFIDQLIAEFERDKPGMLGLEAVEQFRRFGGIRIEDNLRVESRGHENLTRSAFGE